MARGGSQTQRVDIIDSYDPRIVGRAAQKGTTFRYIPSVGNPELLIKGDASDTDWQSVGGGGGGGMNTNFSNAVASAIDINLGNHKLINVTDPTSAQDAATKNYVDTADAGKMNTNFSNAVASANDIDLGSHKLVNVLDPTSPQDAATKNYVDSVGTGANTALSNLVAVAINTDLVYGTGVSGVLRTNDEVGDITQSLVIKSGDASGAASGAVTVESGATDNVSGAVVVRSGNGSISGSVTITSGDGISGGHSGIVSVLTGTPSGADDSGAIIVRTSDSPGGTTGSLTLETGDVAGNVPSSGAITIKSGNNATQATGAISITTGDSAGFSASGDIVIATGSSNGSAIGQVILNAQQVRVSLRPSIGDLSKAVFQFDNFSPNHNTFVEISTANSSGGDANGLRLKAGNVTVSSDHPGDVQIVAGSGVGHTGGAVSIVSGDTSTIGAGGNIALGTGSGPAGRGSIYFQDGTEGTLGNIWMEGPNPGEGHWAPRNSATNLRVITGNDLLSAVNDYKAVCNQPGGGAFTLTLPAGTQGQNFVLGQAATNTATFTIAPTGGDILDANIQAIFNTNQPVSVTFDAGSGTWYAI